MTTTNELHRLRVRIGTRLSIVIENLMEIQELAQDDSESMSDEDFRSVIAALIELHKIRHTPHRMD